MCAQGKYRSVWSSTAPPVCQTCPAGRWSSVEGLVEQTQCVECPRGKWSVKPGATDASVCTLCTGGTFSDTLGGNTSTVCKLCEDNRFSNKIRTGCDESVVSTSKVTLSATEGETKMFQISIRKPLVTGATVTVTVVSSSTSDFTASPASFVITSNAYVQVVTVTFVDDDFEEPDVEDSNYLTLTFTSALDDAYDGRNITIPVTVVDNDVAAARFEFTKRNEEKRTVPSASMLTSKGIAVPFNVVCFISFGIEGQRRDSV